MSSAPITSAHSAPTLSTAKGMRATTNHFEEDALRSVAAFLDTIKKSGARLRVAVDVVLVRCEL